MLDFYIDETMQRKGMILFIQGYGKQLFEFMLQVEFTQPSKLAYDRPSSKFLTFLKKNYQLSKYINQVNNFVIFEQYGLRFLEIGKSLLKKDGKGRVLFGDLSRTFTLPNEEKKRSKIPPNFRPAGLVNKFNAFRDQHINDILLKARQPPIIQVNQMDAIDQYFEELHTKKKVEGLIPLVPSVYIQNVKDNSKVYSKIDGEIFENGRLKKKSITSISNPLLTGQNIEVPASYSLPNIRITSEIRDTARSYTPFYIGSSQSVIPPITGSELQSRISIHTQMPTPAEDTMVNLFNRKKALRKKYSHFNSVAKW